MLRYEFIFHKTVYSAQKSNGVFPLRQKNMIFYTNKTYLRETFHLSEPSFFGNKENFEKGILKSLPHQPTPQGGAHRRGFGIDHMRDSVDTRVPVASRKDSRP